MMKKDARFTTKFDQMDIGYALIDSTTGHLIKANKKFCDMAGLEGNIAEGTSFMDIDHHDDAQGNLHKMQELMQGGLDELTMELNYTQEDGSIVFCNLTIASLWSVDDELAYHIAILEDTTERKSSENQLKKTNDLLGQRVQDLMAELASKTEELELTKKLPEFKSKVHNPKIV